MKKANLCFWISVLFLAFTGSLSAQQKRSLTHLDYDSWESVSSERISKNGAWAGFEINPQDGDGRLEIVSHQNENQKNIIPRASRLYFSNNSEFAVGKINPQKDSVHYYKLKKTKAENMPKDSLFILNLKNQIIDKHARVKSFSLPEKEGNWVAIHFEKELLQKEEKSVDVDTTIVRNVPKEKRRKSEGTKLLVLSLEGPAKFEFHRVKNYGFSENGEYFFYIKAQEDTLKNTGIFLLNLKTGVSKIIDVKKTDYFNPVFSSNNKYLSYLTTEDSIKSKKPYYDLFLYETQKETNQKIAAKDFLGIEGRISKEGRLFFSEDESRLFFGTSPDYVSYSYEEDSTILDEDRVSLDIWGWQENEIQPMQLKNRKREENRTFLSMYNLKTKKILPIGDQDISKINVDSKAKSKYGIGLDDTPYRRNYSWDIQIGQDLYLVDLETGNKSLIQKDVPGNPQLSPSFKYIYWYDNRDSSWVSYDILHKNFKNLTKDLESVFYNEQHDSPSLPSSYGTAGWLKGDEGFLLYDKYDIWKIDPTSKSKPINLTLGQGRDSNISFRRVKLEKEEEGIDPTKPFMLSAFHETNKKSGFFKGDIYGNKLPEQIIFSDHRYFGLNKAENADKFLVRRSTFQEYADVFATDSEMTSLRKLSTANPQQANVKWGSVELVDYLANDGTPLQGLLFKPEGFDPTIKYPMISYFYERNSDGLHNYRAPAPSASTINIPYFVSNDYLVFVPDIKYDLGLPGPSAYNCIIPGVQAIVARGYVDAENLAIQGQSWGGYQVAHLITRTNLFKAAGAGAPVVNMTSAYGGIRWGSGMSRMFQYEQTQSRIGGTLWEKPFYYLENSPLFFMDRVTTPVLIMHNDDDGSVPWYQGIEMFMALKRLNKPAWLLQYNGEDHNLRLRKNRKDLSIRLSQFFDHYLKGYPAPLWMTEGIPAVEKGRTLKYELEEEGS